MENMNIKTADLEMILRIPGRGPMPYLATPLRFPLWRNFVHRKLILTPQSPPDSPDGEIARALAARFSEILECSSLSSEAYFCPFEMVSAAVCNSGCIICHAAFGRISVPQEDWHVPFLAILCYPDI